MMRIYGVMLLLKGDILTNFMNGRDFCLFFFMELYCYFQRVGIFLSTLIRGDDLYCKLAITFQRRLIDY